MTERDAIEIVIDKQEVRTRAKVMNGKEIRALHTPPISADRDLWLAVPGMGVDPKIGDHEEVQLQDRMRFYVGAERRPA